MLTPETLDAFAQKDTRFIADTLVNYQLMDTDAGDAVLAALANHPERKRAVMRSLKRRGFSLDAEVVA